MLIDSLASINDKLMIRAQNQFTKIKEKEEMSRDLTEKYHLLSDKIDQPQAEHFHRAAEKVLRILRFMHGKGGSGWKPSYPAYFNSIKAALARGAVSNVPSLLLFALRQWGPMYSNDQYVIFALLLAMDYNNRAIEDIYEALTPENVLDGSILKLIGRPPLPILHPDTIEQEIAQSFISIFQGEDHLSVEQILRSKHCLHEPTLWPDSPDPTQKVIQLVSSRSHTQVREKLQAENTKIMEPSQEDPLEALLKKNNSEQVTVLTFNPGSLSECEKLLRHWNLRESSTILTHSKEPEIDCWTANLDNPQTIFLLVA